jgi:hypothetical protein
MCKETIKQHCFVDSLHINRFEITTKEGAIVMRNFSVKHIYPNEKYLLALHGTITITEF